MLSDDVKKELDKYNQRKKVQYKPTCPRMAKVPEQDHDEAGHQDNPEPDLENYLHMIHTLCKTLTLKTSWKHMVIAQSKWHQHIAFPSTLLPPMGLW